MIQRYTHPLMSKLWSEEHQFEVWLQVEIAACEAWSIIGVIPKDDVQRLKQNASFDVERIHEIEKSTHHDVVAFTRSVSEKLGSERKWIHYGLTSSDVVDTAWSVRLIEANQLIIDAMEQMLQVLHVRAIEHRHTLMMGRTHGVHAEPTTFGLKLALYYAEMSRNLSRLKSAAEELRTGKLSGAVGTFAHTPAEVEQITCEILGLKPEPIATQVIQRDRHAHYVSVLALIGASLEKIAVEFRHLQRSEVREVEEAFGKGQKGSSAMPHKRNPIGSENITGCARLIRGYMVSAMENVALWHERDISHSSVERVILPDATTIIHYALLRMTRILRNLVVFPERMKKNMKSTQGLYHSQRLMLKLIDSGLTREEAYDLVQPLAMKSWNQGLKFIDIVIASQEVKQHLSVDEIRQLFSAEHHMKQVDVLLTRAGITLPD
ncbi:MAG: adenylosuccinate lyase [Bacteroidetes bacterium]|nr:adenylosuccinate lyase [Bacteroidota bacterium]MCY4233481.1 adenylosuccinate lyase [Bacteroidota bacterium]